MRLPTQRVFGGLKTPALCKLVATRLPCNAIHKTGPVRFRACTCSDRVLGSCAASTRSGFDGFKSAFIPGKLWLQRLQLSAKRGCTLHPLLLLLTMLMTMLIRSTSAMRTWLYPCNVIGPTMANFKRSWVISGDANTLTPQNACGPKRVPTRTKFEQCNAVVRSWMVRD